jgi:hypothetical protein
MYVTVKIDEWLNANMPRSESEKMGLKYALSRQHDDEPPYLVQDFRRDHFVTGYASVLWLQSIDAWSELNRVVEERLGITIHD